MTTNQASGDRGDSGIGGSAGKPGCGPVGCLLIPLLLIFGGWIGTKWAQLGGPPIVSATIAGNTEAVKKMIEAGSDVNERGRLSRSALHWAVYQGNDVIVVLLLEKGALVNAKDHESWTPLHFAVYGNRLEIARLLLEKGADPKQADNYGKKPSDMPGISNAMSELLQQHAQ